MRHSRAQRRIRQVQFHLPPSGITGVVYGDEPGRAGRGEGRESGAADGGGPDLRLKVRPSTRPALAKLMQWGKIDEQGEALTPMIHHVQGLGHAGVARLMRTPRHKIECRGKVAPIIQVAELRLRARPGTVQALEALREWIGTEHHGATVALLIDRLHDLGSA
jgi:hypothetical protein